MTHPREETLVAYLDGELTEAQRAAVDAHVGGCDVCRRELDAAARARSLLAGLPDVPVPLGVTAPVLREAGVDPTPATGSTRQRRPPAARLLAAAAALVVVVGGAAVAIRTADRDPTPTSSVEMAAETPTVPQRDIDNLDRIAAEKAAALDPGDPSAGSAASAYPIPSGTPGPEWGTGDLADRPGDLRTLGATPAKVQACLREAGALDGAAEIVETAVGTYAGTDAYFVVLLVAPDASSPADRVDVWVLARTDCRILAFTTKYIPSMRPSPPTGFPSP